METSNISTQQRSPVDENPPPTSEEDKSSEDAMKRTRCLEEKCALNLKIIKRGSKFKINHEVVFLSESSSCSTDEPDESNIDNEKILGPSQVGIECIDLTGEKNFKPPATVGIQFKDFYC